MSEQKRLQILLQVICLLKSPGGYSVQRLAARYGVHERTIYRYFELLRECGFETEKRGDRFFLARGSEYENLLPLLDAEEASLLRDVVLSLHPTHPQRSELLKKLEILGDTGQLADLIVNRAVGGAIHRLLQAIREKRQVILRKYHSSHSGSSRDRLVEPVGFSVNMKYLYAFEPEQQRVLQFKPERIGSVEVTEVVYTPDTHHRIRRPDLFGMNGAPRCRVTLWLNPRALNLLLEEYPESGDVIRPTRPGGSEDVVEVKLDVKGFEGVGRFVLGLPGEAEPAGPPEFIAYLKERMGRSGFAGSKDTGNSGSH